VTGIDYVYDPTRYVLNSVVSKDETTGKITVTSNETIDVTQLSYMHFINNDMKNYFPQEVTEMMADVKGHKAFVNRVRKHHTHQRRSERTFYGWSAVGL